MSEAEFTDVFIGSRAQTDICAQTCVHTSESPQKWWIRYKVLHSQEGTGHHRFHHYTVLTCPGHLSIIQSVTPGVHHLSHWPTNTASDHRPPCWSPAWTPHPSRNALGLPPKLPSASLLLPFAPFSQHPHLWTQIHHSKYSVVSLLLSLPPHPLPQSDFRLLSNYSWYSAWVTVFNNVFEYKRALLKEWRGERGRQCLKAKFQGSQVKEWVFTMSAVWGMFAGGNISLLWIRGCAV